MSAKGRFDWADLRHAAERIWRPAVAGLLYLAIAAGGAAATAVKAALSTGTIPITDLATLGPIVLQAAATAVLAGIIEGANRLRKDTNAPTATVPPKKG